MPTMLLITFLLIAISLKISSLKFELKNRMDYELTSSILPNGKIKIFKMLSHAHPCEFSGNTKLYKTERDFLLEADSPGRLGVIIAPITGVVGLFGLVEVCNANAIIDSSKVALDLFDPIKFQPVCAASDNFYQITKSIASSLIGTENLVEFGPLIASILLRIRLEICVFESFIYEAVLPFIKAKGLTWVLPLHETLETVIIGTIFALASNFILLGSTKIFAIFFIYIDALLGVPIRFIGYLLERIRVNNTEKLGKIVSFLGSVIGAARMIVESIDTFVGRYLIFSTTMYIAFKLAHFKIFNDVFPM